MRAYVLSAVVWSLAAAAVSPAADRIALVIGNAKYEKSPLANPVNDADAMAQALEGLQFSVLKKKDLGRADMEDSLLEFHRKLTKGALAVFYYAGHGVQVKGENYLIPVDARIREEYEVSRECFKVDGVLAALKDSPSRLNVVVLDCCRDNPFKRSWSRSGGGQGLAPIGEIPEGMLIAFSTSPGTVAADGRGPNSPYTQRLVGVLRSRPAEGLELVNLFRQASRAVKEATGQTPWLNMEASLPEYLLWRPSGVESRQQVTAQFEVREEDKSGPAMPDVEVELLWQPTGQGAATVLGRSRTDTRGQTLLPVWIDPQQRREGKFLVLLRTPETTKSIALEKFPDSPRWNLYLPAVHAQEVTNTLGMKLRLIPAGEFMMGSRESAEQLAAAFKEYGAPKPDYFKGELR
jgi:hypothetical protein